MSSVPQVRDALTQVISIEGQLPVEFAPPNVMYHIFEKFSFQEATQEKPASFVLSNSAQGTEISRVHDKMREILSIVSADMRTLQPDDRLKVERFQHQMQQFDACHSAEEAGEQQTAPLAHQSSYSSVEQVKAKISKPFTPLWKQHSYVIEGVGLSGGFGAAMLAEGIIITAALGVGAAGIALGITLPIALPFLGLAILMFAWLMHQLRHRKANEKAFAAATTPNQMVPLFSELTPEAQARLFVELGPEFRTKLCEWNERQNKDAGMRQLADIVDVLQDGNASVDDQRVAFQSLPLKKLKKLGIYEFQYSKLQEILVEANMTGGVAMLIEKK